MGMDQAPATGVVISHDSLRKLVPDAMETLDNLIKKNDSSWGELAEAVEGGDDDYEHPNEIKAFKALCRAFCKATKVPAKRGKRASNLDLFIGFYDEDKGSMYDDLSHEDGAYFTVGGTTVLTRAGRKMQEHFARELWSQFG